MLLRGLLPCQPASEFDQILLPSRQPPLTPLCPLPGGAALGSTPESAASRLPRRLGPGPGILPPLPAPRHPANPGSGRGPREAPPLAPQTPKRGPGSLSRERDGGGARCLPPPRASSRRGGRLPPHPARPPGAAGPAHSPALSAVSPSAPGPAPRGAHTGPALPPRPVRSAGSQAAQRGPDTAMDQPRRVSSEERGGTGRGGGGGGEGTAGRGRGEEGERGLRGAWSPHPRRKPQGRRGPGARPQATNNNNNNIEEDGVLTRCQAMS